MASTRKPSAAKKTGASRNPSSAPKAKRAAKPVKNVPVRSADVKRAAARAAAAKNAAAKSAAWMAMKKAAPVLPPPPKPLRVQAPRVKKPKPGARPLSRTALLAKESAARRRVAEKKKADLAAVRPLGVLPPESRAKAIERPMPVAVKARPPAAKPLPPRVEPAVAQKVTEKDLKHLEEGLLTERRRILSDMGHLENTVFKVNQRDSSGDLSGYSFHMADAGTDAMEREKAFLFASTEGRLLMEVNDALRRLYNGTYGACEICEQPIARARLEAMPYTRMCVSCKEKEEKAGRSAPSQ
jgi:DnaK suppressor protein